ncbi:MAG: hypothetical protein D6701_15425, partial [Gemmatimonadetes bacterium]
MGTERAGAEGVSPGRRRVRTHALRRASLSAGVLGAALVAGACASSSGPADCSSSGAVPLAASGCIVYEDGGRLDAHRAQLTGLIEQGFEASQRLLPMAGVRVRVFAQTRGVIPEIGIGGFSPSGDEVHLFVDPDSPRIPGSLEEELIPLLAHELHHTRRRRGPGYGATLLEAMVSEGLADHYSM